MKLTAFLLGCLLAVALVTWRAMGTIIGTCCCAAVDCCGGNFPATLHGTVQTSTCPCLPVGTVVTLTQQAGGVQSWKGQTPNCNITGGTPWQVILSCRTYSGADCIPPFQCDPRTNADWCLDTVCVGDANDRSTTSCVKQGYTCSPIALTFAVAWRITGDHCTGSDNCDIILKITA